MRFTQFPPAAAAVRPVQLLRPTAASRPRLQAGRLLPFRHHRGLSHGAAVDIEALRASMAARPAKAIYDVLSPVPSHLLNISLSDYIPPECGAVRFPHSSSSAFSAASSSPSPSSSPPSPSSSPSSFPPSPSSFPSSSPSPNDPFALPTSPSILPHGHHLVHFPLQKPPSLLMPDGTDPDQSPGSPFDRRMWAGGSVRFDRPERLILDGRRAVCIERLGNVKTSGPPGAEKIFVDVWRRYGLVDPAAADPEAAVDASPAVEERRTLVFIRDVPLLPSSAVSSSRPSSRVVKLSFEPDYAFTLTPSATLLFHFSALTYNAHAIHLNPQYCRQVEGHRNLLFHGPLSLVLMLSILRSQVSEPAAIKSLEYRNLAPLYADEPLRVCIRKNNNGAATDSKWDVWVEGPEGGLAVRGSAITA